METAIPAQSGKLQLVAILQYVSAAFLFLLAVCAICESVAVASSSANSGRWIYIVATIVLVVVAFSLFASGLFISSHSHRLFSILVSALFLIFFPLGTAIGIFSLWALTLPETRTLYNP